MFYDFKFEAKYLKLYEKVGLNVEQVLREAGVPPRAVDNDKYQLSLEQYKAILEVFNEELSPELVVEFSKIESTVVFVPEFFAGLCANNGKNCINRISKYKKIIAPVDMVVETDEEYTAITYVYTDGTKVPHTMVMNAQLNILSILRQGTGIKTLNPITIEAEKEYCGEAMDYAGIQAKISETNKIVFSNRDLKRPFITENNSMWDYLETELNQRLREMETDQSFSATVRKALVELIPSGVSSMETIAYELGMSKRTLQRRLQDEDTTFNEQLNHTRELMVRNYLKSGMSLDEIAFLVNYLDTKSLSRAFKTWTGLSITKYRSEYC